MKLVVNKKIEENIITADITVSELGTNSIAATEELETLHDFPRTFCYKDIVFSANMKMDEGNNPVITDSEPDGSTIANVELELINKSFDINEDLHLTLTLDVNKINKNDLSDPFDTIEKLGKARIELYCVKVQEEIKKKLEEIRTLATTFEGETEVIL